MSKRSYGSMLGTSTNFGMNFQPKFEYTRTTNTYAGGGAAGGVRFSKERHRVGKRTRRNRTKLSDLFSVMQRQRWRWQLCSNTLTGPGRIPIGFGGDTTTDGIWHSMPIHFMSLSQNGYNVNSGVAGIVNAAKGAFGHGLYRVCRNTTDGTLGIVHFESNTDQGINNYNILGHWQSEREGNNSGLYHGVQFHKWSEVRMNLYGAKYIPLVYTISVVQVPKSYDPFQYTPSIVDAVTPPVGNQPEFGEFTRWMEDISRSICCNPLNTAGTKKEYKNNVRILRQYKVNVQPLSYSNASAEGTASVKVGNVREFKMFMRHDRWRQYCWAETDNNIDVDRNYSDLGWDVKTIDTPVTDVKWGSRLFMFITCTTGPIRDGPQNNVRTYNPIQLSDIPEDYGSYDIIVRNEFMGSTL